MNQVKVIIRPKKRTQIQGLPYTGNPSDNYLLLENCIDASRRGQVTYGSGSFWVSRSHTQKLIRALAQEFGQVHVIQYGGTEKCVEACWSANPETAGDCECSCAGANHGSSQPFGTIVSEDGYAGALSVSPAAPREYDVHRNEER